LAVAGVESALRPVEGLLVRGIESIDIEAAIGCLVEPEALGGVENAVVLSFVRHSCSFCVGAGRGFGGFEDEAKSTFSRGEVQIPKFAAGKFWQHALSVFV